MPSTTTTTTATATTTTAIAIAVVSARVGGAGGGIGALRRPRLGALLAADPLGFELSSRRCDMGADM